MMKFDTVIIGGGLAGLTCGIRLAKAGKRCAIVSSGQSALHFSSGSLDLLNVLPDGTEVDNPLEAVKELIKLAPEHPYAKIGAESFAALAPEAAALLAEAGVATVGEAVKNHYRLTPVGALKRAWLTFKGYVTSDKADALPWKSVALFNADGFLDFYTQFLSDEMRKMGTECKVHTFNLPALENIRQNPTEMRSANIARIFDNENTLNELADIISREMGDAEVVLLPAMLGVDCRDSVAKLEKKLCRKVAVIATLPPSVPGLQVQTLLRRYFQELGGVYLLGDTATGYKAAGDCIEAIYTHNHGDIALKAEDYVLATGSYFSQGLVASNGAVREPLFGVDVAYDKVRSNWYERDMFTVQPYEKFGIITDENLKALRDGKKVDNLYAIGAGLAGFNPVKEGCGAGVSMLTAMSVADKILSKK